MKQGRKEHAWYFEIYFECMQIIKIKFCPNNIKIIYNSLIGGFDDETCRLLMKERSDLAGITSAYLEHSTIVGLR